MGWGRSGGRREKKTNEQLNGKKKMEQWVRKVEWDQFNNNSHEVRTRKEIVDNRDVENAEFPLQ